MRMMGGMKRKSIVNDECVVIEPYDPNVSKLFLDYFEGILDEFDDATKCLEIDVPDMSTKGYQSEGNGSYPIEFYSFIDGKTVTFLKDSFN